MPPRLPEIGMRPGYPVGIYISIILVNQKFRDMNGALKFLRTFTLEEFKEWKGIMQIRIIRNEQTGKYFFAYGDKAGAVTSKYPVVKLDHPVISEVISEGRGEQFFLLHNIGDNPQFTTMEVL